MRDKILFLASSPQDFALTQWKSEFVGIHMALQKDGKINHFDLVLGESITPTSLPFMLDLYKPRIVHFSGHGQQGNKENKSGGIFFIDEEKNAKLVRAEVLNKIFTLMRKKFDLDIVVLNSCYSEDQAKALQAEVPYVIGMKADVKDSVAIKFAESLYRGLANYPNDVPYAFSLAQASLEADENEQAHLPVLLQKPT